MDQQGRTIILEGVIRALAHLEDRRPDDVDAVMDGLEWCLRFIGAPLGGGLTHVLLQLAA